MTYSKVFSFQERYVSLLSKKSFIENDKKEFCSNFISFLAQTKVKRNWVFSLSVKKASFFSLLVTDIVLYLTGLMLGADFFCQVSVLVAYQLRCQLRCIHLGCLAEMISSHTVTKVCKKCQTKIQTTFCNENYM